jgi:hypothetical protein
MQMQHRSLLTIVCLAAVSMACTGTQWEEGAEPLATDPSVQEMKDSHGSGGGGGGGGGGGHDDGIVITQTKSPGSQCGTKSCFHIKADKNISHVFLDFGACSVKDFQVLARTDSHGFEDVTDRLKTQGGPCKDLNLKYRLELRGPDREADVCVVFNKAKAANQCEAKTFDQCLCLDCECEGEEH